MLKVELKLKNEWCTLDDYSWWLLLMTSLNDYYWSLLLMTTLDEYSCRLLLMTTLLSGFHNWKKVENFLNFFLFQRNPSLRQIIFSQEHPNTVVKVWCCIIWRIVSVANGLHGIKYVQICSPKLFYLKDEVCRCWGI